jgi:hypothetical protein
VVEANLYVLPLSSKGISQLEASRYSARLSKHALQPSATRSRDSRSLPVTHCRTSGLQTLKKLIAHNAVRRLMDIGVCNR